MCDEDEDDKTPPTYSCVHLTAKSCRYNINGFVEELPQLPENRYRHACSALPSGVRPVQHNIL